MPPASASESPTTWKTRAASKRAAAPQLRACATIAVLAARFGAAGATPPVIDQVGNSVPAGESQRIVTLAPDVTEIVFAIGAGDRVVAVGPTCDFPPAAASRPRVGPADPEAIVATRPDLVIASTAGNEPRVVARLRDIGVRVATLDVTSCARLAQACRLVGTLVGAEAAGGRLAADIDGRCRAARRRAAALPRRNALFVVWWDPLVVAAQGTVHDDLLSLAGLENLAPAAAGRYPRVNPEVLLDPRLELVVAPDEQDGVALFRHLLTTPAGSRLARDPSRVVWLPADPANRPGPRLPLALEALVSARELAP